MPELLSSGIFMHGGMDTRMKWMGEMKTDLVLVGQMVNQQRL